MGLKNVQGTLLVLYSTEVKVVVHTVAVGQLGAVA